MKRLVFLLLAILFICSILEACSNKLRVALFNNMGGPVVVQLGQSVVDIESDKVGEFDYPGEAQDWKLRLKVASCVYTYAMPKSLERYPSNTGRGGPIRAQIEKDAAVFLVPPLATTRQDISALAALQNDGFPLRPVSKLCS